MTAKTELLAALDGVIVEARQPFDPELHRHLTAALKFTPPKAAMAKVGTFHAEVAGHLANAAKFGRDAARAAAMAGEGARADIERNFEARRGYFKQAARAAGLRSADACEAVAQAFADVLEARADEIEKRDRAEATELGFAYAASPTVSGLRAVAGIVVEIAGRRDTGSPPSHRLAWLDLA